MGDGSGVRTELGEKGRGRGRCVALVPHPHLTVKMLLVLVAIGCGSSTSKKQERTGGRGTAGGALAGPGHRPRWGLWVYPEGSSGWFQKNCGDRWQPQQLHFLTCCCLAAFTCCSDSLPWSSVTSDLRVFSSHDCRGCQLL
jgi:hypothetical protein